MGTERSGITILKYVILGVAVCMLAAFIAIKLPKAHTYDKQFVQIKVTEKEVTEINGTSIYLLHTEDQNGNSETFEIAPKALKDPFEAPNVYEEFKKGKHYQLKVADKEEYDSYYRSVCAATRLIEGFSEDAHTSTKK